MRTFITGDKHGEFEWLSPFCLDNNTTTNDILILLGDTGINYYFGNKDKKLKEYLSSLPITIFCIKGNHEEDVRNIPSYKEAPFKGGVAYREDEYYNIYFAKDGEVYNIETSKGLKKFIAIGGAYSVDKYYRLERGWRWFKDEQLSPEQMDFVEEQLDKYNWNIDYVLSHTTPLSYEPVEWFLGFINQLEVDKTMEEWLDTIYSKLTINEKWYCGHYHGEKNIKNIRFLFNSIELI